MTKEQLAFDSRLGAMTLVCIILTLACCLTTGFMFKRGYDIGYQKGLAANEKPYTYDKDWIIRNNNE